MTMSFGIQTHPVSR